MTWPEGPTTATTAAYCTGCGRPRSPEDRFCAACGASALPLRRPEVPVGDAVGTAQPVLPSPTAYGTPKVPQRRNRTVALVAGALAVVLVLVLGIFFLAGPKSSRTDSVLHASPFVVPTTVWTPPTTSLLLAAGAQTAKAYNGAYTALRAVPDPQYGSSTPQYTIYYEQQVAIYQRYQTQIEGIVFPSTVQPDADRVIRDISTVITDLHLLALDPGTGGREAGVAKGILDGDERVLAHDLGNTYSPAADSTS